MHGEIFGQKSEAVAPVSIFQANIFGEFNENSSKKYSFDGTDLRFLQAQIYSRGVLKKYELVVDCINIGLASSSKV